jgi:hypothetical protein
MQEPSSTKTKLLSPKEETIPLSVTPLAAPFSWARRIGLFVLIGGRFEDEELLADELLPPCEEVPPPVEEVPLGEEDPGFEEVPEEVEVPTEVVPPSEIGEESFALFGVAPTQLDKRRKERIAPKKK